MGKVVTTGVVIVSTEVTVREYSLGRVSKETIYTDDTRVTKAQETVYTYSGSKVTQGVKTTYGPDGTTAEKVETVGYFEDATAVPNKTVEKRS